MSLTEKNIREKEFHNSLQNKKRGRFENVFYKAIYNLGEDFFKYLEKKSNNAEILDYGCGTGLSIEKLQSSILRRLQELIYLMYRYKKQ